MPRNPTNPKPQNSPCEGGQFNDYGDSYYQESWGPEGWLPKGGPASSSPGGDPGHFRNPYSCGDFVDAKSYGYEIPEQDDRGQNPVVERITVDVGTANRGNES